MRNGSCGEKEGKIGGRVMGEVIGGRKGNRVCISLSLCPRCAQALGAAL